MRAMARGTEELVTSFAEYTNFGTFPGPGGRRSQAVTWLHSSSVFLAEKGRIERARDLLEAASRGM